MLDTLIVTLIITGLFSKGLIKLIINATWITIMLISQKNKYK